jgi:hypothetical protein
MNHQVATGGVGVLRLQGTALRNRSDEDHRERYASDYMNPHDPRFPGTAAWERRYHQAEQHLDTENAVGAADFVKLTGRFVPCPDRGTHLYVGQCWKCHADVLRGDAQIEEVVAPGVVNPWRRPD